MEHPGFFELAGPFEIAELARHLGIDGTGLGQRKIADIKTLQDAGPSDAAFFNNRKYMADLRSTKAGACIVAPAFVDKLPGDTVPLVVAEPYPAFASLLSLFYPDSGFPKTAMLDAGEGLIAASAEIEAGAVVEPGAVIGREARIGAGTRIASGAVIGYRCMIGRDCYIGPRVSITHTLMGNNVLVHAGASIGQDGFGFAMSPKGHSKVPQVGRVIIQDDVSIGANTTVDRGALNDTVIGQGTKIDNLVQIGHNVVIGRHCVIVSLSGVAGSARLGDFVVMAGKSGVPGHLTIGDGAQIAGASHPIVDVPAGAKVGGTPAKPYRQWAREQAILRRLVNEEGGS